MSKFMCKSSQKLSTPQFFKHHQVQRTSPFLKHRWSLMSTSKGVILCTVRMACFVAKVQPKKRSLPTSNGLSVAAYCCSLPPCSAAALSFSSTETVVPQCEQEKQTRGLSYTKKKQDDTPRWFVSFKTFLLRVGMTLPVQDSEIGVWFRRLLLRSTCRCLLRKLYFPKSSTTSMTWRMSLLAESSSEPTVTFPTVTRQVLRWGGGGSFV